MIKVKLPIEPGHCACGLPLHYTDPNMETITRELVARLGEFIPITCNGRTWLVQRHYIALHGVKARELHGLGFEEES